MDILNQSTVLQHITNHDQAQSSGHYSFDAPVAIHFGGQPDTEGCLVHDKAGHNVWIVHNDSTRNWISEPTSGCVSKALLVTESQLDSYTKRYGAKDPRYALDKAASASACLNNACPSPPAPAPPAPVSGMHFIVLNGDFNEQGEPWFDIDNSSNKAFNWAQPWVPTSQMEW